MVRKLVTVEDRAGVKTTCQEIFDLRAKHSWPPRVTVLPSWTEIYSNELEDVPGFEPSDVHEAADEVNQFIKKIDAADR